MHRLLAGMNYLVAIFYVWNPIDMPIAQAHQRALQFFLMGIFLILMEIADSLKDMTQSE
jgi:hypothetical protein